MNKYMFLLVALAGLAACGAESSTIPGTKVPDTQANRDLIQVLEQYRNAVERQDVEALILMASKRYWEDGGTPTGSDDYGYKELGKVLTGRFKKSSDIRYSLRYMEIKRRCPSEGDNEGCRVYVDVLIDASYSVPDARGNMVRLDKRDQNQLVLEWDKDATKWKFLSGM
jgi:hypothetical protein